MSLTFDYTNLMKDSVGEEGLTDADFKRVAEQTPAIHAKLQERRTSGELGFYDLPTMDQGVDKIKAMATHIRENFDTLVVLGIGGSALGVIAQQAALGHTFHNLLPKEKRGGAPRLFVPDNPDPEMTADLLDVIDPKTTIFNVVSKSGSTAETMAHYLVVRNLLRRTVGESKLKNHLVFTTDPKNGVLRKIADAEGIECLDVPPNVGGRFCVLSAVGLLPAAVMGVDIDALLAGAGEMGERCGTDDLMANPAYLYAAAHLLLQERGKNVSVMMPYSSALRYLSDWFAQLWAESLGKRHDVDGKIVEVGQTPVKALGATDQHSQVQLYVEGPHDKVITLLAVEKWRRRCAIPADHTEEDALAYLGGHDLGELLNIEMRATEHALSQNQRPNCRIDFPKVDAKHIGEFYMMMEIATAFGGGMLNINAFDQPGVEEGKIATYALMDRPGHEETKSNLVRAFTAQQRRAL